MEERGRIWRSLAIGAVLGLVGVIGLGVWALQVARRAAEPPTDILVVALTRDTDGAVVAGVVFAVDRAGDAVEPRFADTTAKVPIPGTSYDTLRDSYAFGGGSAVLDAVKALGGADSGLGAVPDEWVVLPEETWVRLVDETGGARVDVPTDVNAFSGGELHMIPEGERSVSGAELAVLANAIGYVQSPAGAGRLRFEVGSAVARAVSESWDSIAEAVDSGAASSSVRAEALTAFAADADNR